MTETNEHGLALVYKNKAMDLWSLSANINEHLVYQDDQRRAEIVETLTSQLERVNATIQRYTRLEFSRASFNVIPTADLLSNAATPAGTVHVLPVDIHGDRFTLNMFTRDDSGLDPRRVLSTLEHIQTLLDEVRRVTLVRGINFVQQDQVLQHYSSRFLQYAEGDIISGKWAPASDAVEPEYALAGKAETACKLDATSAKITLDTTPSAVECIVPDLDEELVLAFMMDCVPPPMVARLAADTFSALRETWGELSRAFMPSWRVELTRAFLRRVVSGSSIAGCDPFTATTGELAGSIASTAGSIISKAKEFLAGLGAKMEDMEDSGAGMDQLDTLVESYSALFGNIEGLDAIMGAIRDGLEERAKTAIDPGMTGDFVTVGQVAHGISKALDGMQGDFITAVPRAARIEITRRVAHATAKMLEGTVLGNEKGVVRAIGARILARANDRYLNDELAWLQGAGTNEASPLIDPGIFVARYKNAVREVIDGFALDPSELIQFAANLLDDEEQDTVDPHVQKFLALKRDVAFLREHLLQENVFNTFLEKHADHFYDPKSFAKQFSDFTSKAVAQLPVEWTILVPNWMAAFSNVYQIQHAQVPIPRPKIIEKFFEFLEIVVEEQNKFENIFSIISTYVSNLPDSRDKRILLEFMKRFEQSQGVQEKLPGYFEKRVSAALDETDIQAMLAVDTASESFLESVVERCHEDLTSLFRDAVVVPRELDFHLVGRANVGIKLACKVDGNVASIDLHSNWFKQAEGI